MKHRKLINAILVLALPCLALQCNNNNDAPNPNKSNDNEKEQLPPATQSGENTFGCLVNGEVWRPHSENTFYDNALNASYGLGQLNINASIDSTMMNGNRLLQGIDIYLNNHFKTAGKYNFKKYSEDSINKINYARYESGYNNVCQYYTYSNNGFIKITRLDSIRNIVSGRFEFTAVNDSCGDVDTIRVTKGRFDIKYAH